MHKLYKQDRRRLKGDIAHVRPWFKTRAGTKLKMRLLRADDNERLIEFFDHLSPETRWRRFHMNVQNVTRDLVEQRARELAAVDNHTVSGAVAAILEDKRGEHIVGVVRLGRPEETPAAEEAEAAIVVRDDFQGQGVGRELLRWMILLARQMGVKTILALFQPDNDSAIHLFRELDLPYRVAVNHGSTEMRIEVPEEVDGRQ